MTRSPGLLKPVLGGLTAPSGDMRHRLARLEYGDQPTPILTELTLTFFAVGATITSISRPIAR